MAQTQQAASGKEATQITVCNLMGSEIPECQPGSPFDEGMTRPSLMLRPPNHDGWGGEEMARPTCISNLKHVLAHSRISKPGHLLHPAPSRGRKFRQVTKRVANTKPGINTHRLLHRYSSLGVLPRQPACNQARVEFGNMCVTSYHTPSAEVANPTPGRSNPRMKSQTSGKCGFARALNVRHPSR